jgi:tetratricopeptide (TPR) repeat protein
LAKSLRGQKKLAEAEKIYKQMLVENKDNIDAKMGLGYVEIDSRNFEKAREYFNQVLSKNPENTEAKMGVTYAYLGNGERLKALEALSKIHNNDEVKLTRAQTFYDMGMFSDSKNAITGTVKKDANDLKYKIRRDDAITITPVYSCLIQTLAENYKLDVNRFGTNISQNIDNNLTVFADYNIYVYSSGQFGPLGINQLNNVTNELRGGVYGRPKEKLEFRADFGCKFFEFGGGLLNTDSWIKYYLNDTLNFKFGVKRNNLEQSYLSAVGFPLDGVFTGRTADNKLYVDFDSKLPKDLYAFGRISCGLVTAQNLETNNYAEGLIGIGKLVYNNPENKWVKTVNVDLVSYNAGYKNNLLTIYNSAGEGFGGYFSPSYFNAETLNIKVEGEIKKWHLRYGLKGFAGPQLSMTPNQTSMAWSLSPYLSYAINDHVTLNAAYTHFNYADVQRDAFLFSANIRGFKNARK